MVLKNKRGFGGIDLTQWLMRLLFLTAVIFSCVFLIRSYIDSDIDISNTEMQIFTYRVLYSPNSIMYTEDNTGRVYPGIVDYDNFLNGENLTMKAIDYTEEKSYLGAKFWLKNKDKTFYYYKNNYDMYKPLVGVGGATDLGGVDYLKRDIFVLVYEDGKYVEDRLIIEVVTPRT